MKNENEMVEKLYLKEFSGNERIDKKLIDSSNLPSNLPNDYLEFIQLYNGGEGDVGEEYLVLHKAEELNEINKDYKIAEFDSNIFIIGSNGSGELIAIDFRKENPSYILIPYIFEYDAIIELSSDIERLFQRIYEKGYFGN